jgi:hypothetical protein
MGAESVILSDEQLEKGWQNKPYEKMNESQRRAFDRDRLNKAASGIIRPEFTGPSASTTTQSVLGGLVDQTKWDTRASDAVAKEALRSGPSAWRGMMDQQMATKYSGLADQQAQQQAGQLGQARSALAMRGGLRGGSAERLAGQGMQQGLLGQQRLARQRSEEGMGYNVQDELNRLSQLGQLGQMDAAKAAFQGQQSQFNIGGALNTLGQRNQFNLDKYKEQMADLCAQRTSFATQYGKK